MSHLKIQLFHSSDDGIELQPMTETNGTMVDHFVRTGVAHMNCCGGKGARKRKGHHV